MLVRQTQAHTHARTSGHLSHFYITQRWVTAKLREVGTTLPQPNVTCDRRVSVFHQFFRRAGSLGGFPYTQTHTQRSPWFDPGPQSCLLTVVRWRKSQWTGEVRHCTTRCDAATPVNLSPRWVATDISVRPSRRAGGTTQRWRRAASLWPEQGEREYGSRGG
jgi:hypothetical protein